jgi:hypothetical protein
MTRLRYAACGLTLAAMTLTGCATRPVVTTTEPAVTISTQEARLAMGPPPGYVQPKRYWVREKIILGELTTVIEREVK